MLLTQILTRLFKRKAAAVARFPAAMKQHAHKWEALGALRALTSNAQVIEALNAAAAASSNAAAAAIAPWWDAAERSLRVDVNAKLTVILRLEIGQSRLARK